MSTGQRALRARYRNLMNDLLLSAVMRRYWIFHCHLVLSALVPGLAIYMVNQGARGAALTLLMILLGSWLLAGCVWLLLGCAARPDMINAAYRKVGVPLTPQLCDRFATRLRGECPKPMSIREVAQITRELIATAGPRALTREARRSQRVAKQRTAIDQQNENPGNA